MKQRVKKPDRGTRIAPKTVSRQPSQDMGALAKITRSSLSGIYPRNRLFRLLDQARRKHPIIWISAPGGSGKTTLIASYAQARRLPVLWYQIDSGDNDPASFFYYLGLAAKARAPRYKRALPLLTAEYLAGVSTFATNYFRELFARLKRPGLVVFDNYQELSAEGMVQDILQCGVAEIPPQLNVVVVSRVGPPPAFARHRAADHIALVGWEELKLTAPESNDIVKRRTRDVAFSREALGRLHERTQGWVAGLVLLTEQAERGMAVVDRRDNFTGEAVFDYFASEIFRHVEVNVQTFLLKTAFLPKIVLPIAEALTGERNAEAILNYLARRNLFTVRHADASYEYHPLFRGFLAARAPAQFSEPELQAIKRESAKLLAEADDIDNAVALLLQTPAGPAEALALILARAKTLVATGRTKTLESWLTALPQDARAGNPWVLYWLGICRLTFAPAEARSFFEQAFALFEKKHDASPIYLAWSGIIESYALERNDFTPMRPWLDRYHTLAGHRIGPVWEIETTSMVTYVLGLISTAFEHPDLPVCARALAERMARESEPERWLMGLVTLIPYYTWRGEIDRLRSALARLGSHAHSPEGRPLAQLSWYTWTCLYEAANGATEASLQAAKDGIALANRTGVHVFDTQLLGYGLYGQLCAGNVAVARDLLQQLQPLIGERLVANAFYNHFASLVFLAEGDLSEAVTLARRAARQARDSGLSLGEMNYSLALAFILTAHGELEGAADALSEARRLTSAMGSRIFTGFTALCEAYLHRARGAQMPMLAALKQALEVLRDARIIFPAYLPRQDAAALCAIALDHGIEVKYTRDMIRKARLLPPADCLPRNWPWALEIQTLGGFTVLKDGSAMIFGGSRRKPRELLRQLIACGGTDVPVGRLLQALWPEADGDMARFSFKTTLHRLRRMIGDQALVLADGKLSLNPSQCWLDVWAFERALAATATDAEAGRALFDLYRGAFLPDEDSPLVVLQRERLRAKFLAGAAEIGRSLEHDSEAAIAWYQKGVEVDPSAEEFYRQLMRHFRRLNRYAEALDTYSRCRSALAALLDMEPSPATEALWAEIRARRA